MKTKSTVTPAPRPELATSGPEAWADALDRRDGAWWDDLAARLLVLIGGVSAILFIGAIFLFGGFWGFWGVFFAVPLATFVRSIVRVLQQRRLELPEAAETESG